jgi:hypothetical protein
MLPVPSAEGAGYLDVFWVLVVIDSSIAGQIEAL